MYNISEHFTFRLPISIVTVEAATPCEFSVKNPMLKLRTFLKLFFWCSGLLYPIGRQIQYSTCFKEQSHGSIDFTFFSLLTFLRSPDGFCWRIFLKIRTDN
jgi:hypothetical protein